MAESLALGELLPAAADADHDRLGTEDPTVAELGRLTDPVLASLGAWAQIRDDRNDVDGDLTRGPQARSAGDTLEKRRLRTGRALTMRPTARSSLSSFLAL